MPNNRWSVPLEKVAEIAKADLETVAQKITLDLFRRVVLRSPVGNPELWAANDVVVAERKAYVDSALAFNAANLDKRRRGTGRKTVERKFPLTSGKGYVGGRFRANWNVSYGTPNLSTTESVDKQRGLSEAERALSLPVGGVVYLSNGLPYAERLEFGHSKRQAPAGMVRITVAEFADIVKATK